VIEERGGYLIKGLQDVCRSRSRSTQLHQHLAGRACCRHREKSGRKQLVLAALYNRDLPRHAAIQALGPKDYDVFMSPMLQAASRWKPRTWLVRRMAAAGAVPINLASCAGEWQRIGRARRQRPASRASFASMRCQRCRLGLGTAAFSLGAPTGA